MPRAGDEFTTLWIDDKAASYAAKRTTYRYREDGRTVDPVKIVTRQIKMAELRFPDDPWQPAYWVYHYGTETTWTA